MKKLLAFVMAALLAFGGIAAAAEEADIIDSLENTTNVTVALTKPLPEALGSTEELESAISGLAMTLAAKLDFSEEFSLKVQFDLSAAAGLETENAQMYFWTDYREETGQVGFCFAGKAEDDTIYDYVYVPSDIFSLSQTLMLIKQLTTAGHSIADRDSLLANGFTEQDGVFVSFVTAAQIEEALALFDIEGMLAGMSAEGMPAEEQNVSAEKIAAMLQNGVFAEEALRIELIPSADDAYLEMFRLTMNFDMSLSDAAELADMELPPEAAGERIAFQIKMENTVGNLGNAQVMLPELSLDNTAWTGETLLHTVYRGPMMADYITEPLLLQTEAGGVTMVPAIEFLESVGIWGDEMAFDAETGTFIIEPEWSGKTIEFTVGETQAAVNGENVPLLAAPIDMGDDILIPLRFAAETLGLSVEYIPFRDPVGYSIGGRAVIMGEVARPLEPITVMVPNDFPEELCTKLESLNAEVLKFDTENYVEKSMIILAVGEPYLLADNGRYPEASVEGWIEQAALGSVDELVTSSEAFAEYLAQDPALKESVIAEDGSIYWLPLEANGETWRLYVCSTFNEYEKLTVLADGLYVG